MKKFLAKHSTLLLFAFFATLLRAWLFTQSEFAQGWDSYFYLVQIKSVAETGKMHSPEASLIYPYFLFIKQFCGANYVLAYQIGTAVLCGLFTLLCGIFSLKIGTFRAPFLLMSWCCFSPHLTWFAAQYPKNLLGVILFLGLLIALSSSDKTPLTKWISVAILLIINYLGHRLMFGLSCLLLLFYGFGIVKNFTKPSRFRKVILSSTAILLLLFVASKYFPGLFHLADFGRFKGVFSQNLHFAPLTFALEFWQSGRMTFWWAGEIFVFCLLFIVGVFQFFCQYFKNGEKKSNLHFAFCALLLLLLFPFLEWSLTGFSFRLVVVWGLLVPIFLVGLGSKIDLTTFKKLSNLLIAFLIVASFFSIKNYQPKQHDANYNLYKTLTNIALQNFKTQKSELIIAHNALAEYFTFTSGIDAMPWEPEYEIKLDRLWRIAYGFKAQELRFFAPEEKQREIFALADKYTLLEEQTWQIILEKARQSADSTFLQTAENWKNPNRIRPNFLLRKKS